MFCRKCGKEIDNEAVMCVHCGVPTKNKLIEKSKKSKKVHIILGIIFGSLGIHNFYAGYHVRGLIKLLLIIVSSIVFSCAGAEEGSIIDISTKIFNWGIWGWGLVEISRIKTDAKGKEFR